MVISYLTRLDELMEKQGRKNKWLAYHLGHRTGSPVSLWRNGHRPIPRRNVQRIADLLGVTVEELVIRKFE